MQTEAETIFNGYMEALSVWKESLAVTAAIKKLIPVKTDEVLRVKVMELQKPD
jgi:hypothetical protein